MKIINLQLPPYVLYPVLIILLAWTAVPALMGALDGATKLPPKIVELQSRLDELYKIEGSLDQGDLDPGGLNQGRTVLTQAQIKEKAQLEKILSRYQGKQSESKPLVAQRTLLEVAVVITTLMVILLAGLFAVIAEEKTDSMQKATVLFAPESAVPAGLSNKPFSGVLLNFAMHKLVEGKGDLRFVSTAQFKLIALCFIVSGLFLAGIQFFFQEFEFQGLQLGELFNNMLAIIFILLGAFLLLALLGKTIFYPATRTLTKTKLFKTESLEVEFLQIIKRSSGATMNSFRFNAYQVNAVSKDGRRLFLTQALSETGAFEIARQMKLPVIMH
jgi:hypothetical protein